MCFRCMQRHRRKRLTYSGTSSRLTVSQRRLLATTDHNLFPRVKELLSTVRYHADIGPSLPHSTQRGNIEVSRTVEAGLTEGRSRGKVWWHAHNTAAPTCQFPVAVPEHSAWCDRKNTSRALPQTSRENEVQSAEARSEQTRRNSTYETEARPRQNRR